VIGVSRESIIKALSTRNLIIIITVAFGILPVLLGFNRYYVYLATQVVIFTSMVLAWNIIGGYAGQLDLAAAAYMGLGGAITGLLLCYYHLTPWIGMIVGALAAVGLAVAIGYPTFRYGLREVWYALSTISLVLILQRIYWLIYGTTEEYISEYIPYRWSVLYLRFDRYEPYYYLGVAILLVTLWVNITIRRSKLGYYLRAISEDEDAAEALGIDVRRYKLYALMIYAAIVGLVGGLYITTTGIITYRLFDPDYSLSVAVAGIIGGLGSIPGALIAGVILKTVEEYLRATFGAVILGLHLMIYGILLVAVSVSKPEGLAAIFTYIEKKLLKKGSG